MKPDQIIRLSASLLGERIRNDELSSEAAVEAHLKQIARINPALNAVVFLDSEGALEAARAADKRLANGEKTGPLHGVPMTVKDSFDVAGMISAGGTMGRKNFVPKADATAVKRLRKAGAIILGKTNTPELTLSFSTDNDVYGLTKNPHNLAHSPGGSSGGAAAIVAAFGSPLELGSDTGGSIRQPAHFCGVAGLKPTQGRVPRTGHVVPFGGALDLLTHVGPIARKVEDLALAFSILAGPDWRDPSVAPVPVLSLAQAEIRNLKIGFFTDNGVVSPTKETSDCVEKVAVFLEQFAAKVEDAKPPNISQSYDFYYRLFRADGGAWERRLLKKAGTERSFKFVDWAVDPEQAKPVAAEDFSLLLEELDVFRGEMLQFMAGYDALICPVNASPAFPLDDPRNHENRTSFSYTMTFNLTGWPVVVVPAGVSENGLPIGVQIVAQPWREDVALAVAEIVEKEFGGACVLDEEKIEQIARVR